MYYCYFFYLLYLIFLLLFFYILLCLHAAPLYHSQSRIEKLNVLSSKHPNLIVRKVGKWSTWCESVNNALQDIDSRWVVFLDSSVWTDSDSWDQRLKQELHGLDDMIVQLLVLDHCGGNEIPVTRSVYNKPNYFVEVRNQMKKKKWLMNEGLIEIFLFFPAWKIISLSWRGSRKIVETNGIHKGLEEFL